VVGRRSESVESGGPDVTLSAELAASVELARALAHPLRAQLVLRLSTEGAATAAELAEATRRPRASIAYHLRVLEERGAVERVPAESKARGASTYWAVVRCVIEDDEWVQLPVSVRREIVEQDLRHIGREAHTALARGGFDPGHAHVSWMPVTLDPAGREAMAALLRETVDRALAIAAAVRDRCTGGADDVSQTEVAILHFLRDADSPALEAPPRDVLDRIYAITDEIGDEVPGPSPDWQRIGDAAFALGGLAQRYALPPP
jgi:DNA-binding transcriptional ArsR family regulator